MGVEVGFITIFARSIFKIEGWTTTLIPMVIKLKPLKIKTGSQRKTGFPYFSKWNHHQNRLRVYLWIYRNALERVKLTLQHIYWLQNYSRRRCRGMMSSLKWKTIIPISNHHTDSRNHMRNRHHIRLRHLTRSRLLIHPRRLKRRWFLIHNNFELRGRNSKNHIFFLQ